jgi:hypothetical protein
MTEPESKNSAPSEKSGCGLANRTLLAKSSIYICRIAQVVEQNETEAKAEGVSLSVGSSPTTATKKPLFVSTRREARELGLNFYSFLKKFRFHQPRREARLFFTNISNH